MILEIFNENGTALSDYTDATPILTWLGTLTDPTFVSENWGVTAYLKNLQCVNKVDYLLIQRSHNIAVRVNGRLDIADVLSTNTFEVDFVKFEVLMKRIPEKVNFNIKVEVIEKYYEAWKFAEVLTKNRVGFEFLINTKKEQNLHFIDKEREIITATAINTLSNNTAYKKTLYEEYTIEKSREFFEEFSTNFKVQLVDRQVTYSTPFFFNQFGLTKQSQR